MFRASGRRIPEHGANPLRLDDDLLADLSLVVEPGLSVAADTVRPGVEPEPATIATLTRGPGCLRERPEVVRAARRARRAGDGDGDEAHTLAGDSGEDDLDVSDRTVRRWLSELVDVGVLEDEQEHAAAPRPSTGSRNAGRFFFSALCSLDAASWRWSSRSVARWG